MKGNYHILVVDPDMIGTGDIGSEIMIDLKVIEGIEIIKRAELQRVIVKALSMLDQEGYECELWREGEER